MLLVDLVRRIKDEGHQVSVGYCSPGPLIDTIKSLGITPTHLPRLARIDPVLLWNMIRLIRKVQPDIVHTHLFKSDLHGRLAARLCGVPVVVSTAHNNDAWAKHAPLGTIYGINSRMADQVIAVSEEVRQYQLKYTGIPAKKIRTIENGVDVRRFSGQEQAGQQVRAELAMDADAPLAGIIARLEPQKDHVTFLKAAAIIKQSLPNARFVVVGDGQLRDELVNLAASLGLGQAVKFLGIRKDIPAILAAIDVLVFSSRWEGLPVTLLEGMAARRPIVSTDVGGVAGVVLPEKSAFLVRPEDPQSLAEACIKVMRDKVLARQMGAAGFERVQANYSLDSMLSRTLTLYTDLMGKHA